MPEGQLFAEVQIGDRSLRVVKTYDRAFAREVFEKLSLDARATVGKSLNLEADYDTSEIPPTESSDYADLVWTEIEERARETWNSFSYFVVEERSAAGVRPLFVSADWPSAEALVRSMS